MRISVAGALVLMIGAAATGSAQTKSDAPPAGANGPGASSGDAAQVSSGARTLASPDLSPEKSWPSPVNDEQKFTYILADVLEYQPKPDDNAYRWDIEGWRGGEYNRIWFKSEGQGASALKADYDIDLQLLYGRFVKRYYDFQVGVRAETQTSGGASVTRLHAVIGLQGLVPYKYSITPTLFISQRGDISVRFAGTRDLLFTQRLVLQPRLEINAAIQQVERFTTGRGLNNVELGFRLRYEIRRQFAPYVGISYDESFFSTASLVRQDGGKPRQIRFVAGVRIWH